MVLQGAYNTGAGAPDHTSNISDLAKPVDMEKFRKIRADIQEYHRWHHKNHPWHSR